MGLAHATIDVDVKNRPFERENPRLPSRDTHSRESCWREAGVAPFAWALLLTGVLACAAAVPAQAERIENQVAVFSALDKVTARISKFEVELGKTVAFGNIQVTPRACYSRPATELPKTTTFVEVDETQLDGKQKRIFTGWMFAESPGIFGVEHPTIDVWLTECAKPLHATTQKAPASPQKAAGDAAAADTPAADAPAAAQSDITGDAPRRRVRR